MDTTTVEHHSGAIKRALFSCLSCGCSYEAEHKHKFCIPCADAKERARLKERDAARKAKRAAEGRSLLDRTPEEKAPPSGKAGSGNIRKSGPRPDAVRKMLMSEPISRKKKKNLAVSLNL